jgi:hypothetical protein
MPHDPKLDPIALLRSSQKFVNWKPTPLPARIKGVEKSSLMLDEKHYTPQELSELWGVSVQTIRDLFRDEDGVLKLGSDGTRTRRAYKTLRISHSVAERVHTRLSA